MKKKNFNTVGSDPVKENVNVIVTNSIPLDRRMKKHFIQKYKRMIQSNGIEYACSKFKKLKEVLMAYRADRHRTENVEAYLRKSGFKVNGWLRELFAYCDTQPEYALNFVKLYCGLQKPTITATSAGEDQHKELEECSKVNSSTPAFLTKWLIHFSDKQNKLTQDDYNRLQNHWIISDRWGSVNYHKLEKRITVRRKPHKVMSLIEFARHNEWLHNFVVSHTYVDYCTYFHKWNRVLRMPTDISEEEIILSGMESYCPRPNMYVDRKDSVSESFDKDLHQFISMQYNLDLDYEDGGCGLTNEDYDYVLSLYPTESISLWMDPEFIIPNIHRSFIDGSYVGQIHQVPKKGTTGLRSIAAPNRFLQYGLYPVNYALEILLKRLNGLYRQVGKDGSIYFIDKGLSRTKSPGRDATYDQSRFDDQIVQRVTNDALYAGSVDLHHATDYLPFQWMIDIYDILFREKMSPEVNKSWDLFVHMSKGSWLNVGYRDRWLTGQPLGALPSFKCLGITHNLLVESLCFTNGVQHSPYAIVGDDIVLFNKKCRKAYIKLMQNAGVPLSLHKSYTGNLVEFAGKVFIKNLQPFFITDQRAITWESLFDYQRSTGVHIPLNQLPKNIRSRFSRLCKQAGVPDQLMFKVYDLCILYISQYRGSHFSGRMSKANLELFSELIEALPDNEPSPMLNTASGVYALTSGHPVQFVKTELADKDGWFMRYESTSTPKWYKDKFRPVATDKIVSAAAGVVAANQIPVTSLDAGSEPDHSNVGYIY